MNEPSFRHAEAGFLLVEVMVSAVVLVVLALATLQLIDRSSKQAGSDRSRGVATALAQADQDRLRALKPAALNSFGRAVSTKLVGGINYSITSDVALTRDSGSGGGATVCDTGGTSKAEYFRLLSTVSWPSQSQGTAKPVTIATILSQGVGDPTKGSVTVKLLNEAGVGVPDVTVTTVGLTAVTDSGGCASFSNLSPGTYAFTWSKSGYVDKDGDVTGSKSATVAANQNASISDNYDIAATIPVDLAAADGGAVNWKPSFTIASAANNFSKPVSVTSYPKSVTGLYPFSAGYAVYAGNCPGNRPDQTGYLPSYYSLITDGNVVAAPGATTTTLTSYLRRVKVPVTVTGSNDNKFTYKITADSVPTAMVGCTEWRSPPAPLALVATAGEVNETLPWGTYKVCVEARVNTGPSSTAIKRDTRAISNLPQSSWSANQATLTATAISLSSASTGAGPCP